MPKGVWTYAHLDPSQEQELKQAEQAVGDGVLIAFSETPITTSDLTQEQLDKVHDAEKKLGVTLVAVRKS
ncbi:MAG: hypothetical protein M1319_02225 [Chloroflexi bacterium]|nr:hypothetical protein [Chloroflexota bacterium]